MKIGNWTVEHNPKPVPRRLHDYDVTHDDYDGINGLFFSCSSVEEARTEINTLEDKK